MPVVILPAYSLKNKDWAEQIKAELETHVPTRVIYWPHWETGKSEAGWIESQANKILDLVSEEKIDLLAKSVGTLVAMEMLKIKPDKIGKILLCGIPLNDFLEADQKRFDVLSDIQSGRVLIIQNENDNHAKFGDVKNLIEKVNSSIKIISKPRSDHEYPYTEDFIKFFV